MPALKPLTAEAAIKIISPNGVAGAVNVIVHEHTLDAVYQALRYVQRTEIIAESDKSAWAMVVLQLTGMDSVAGLENNYDYLRKVTELNSKKHENNAWSLRAKNFSDQYETAQTNKFFQKAISKGMISDPSKVEEIIRSTPANTKERLQNIDQALLNVETKLQNIDKAFKIQQHFNTAIAVGLVVSGISFGISLFRISNRLEGQFTYYHHHRLHHCLHHRLHHHMPSSNLSAFLIFLLRFGKTNTPVGHCVDCNHCKRETPASTFLLLRS